MKDWESTLNNLRRGDEVRDTLRHYFHHPTRKTPSNFSLWIVIIILGVLAAGLTVNLISVLLPYKTASTPPIQIFPVTEITRVVQGELKVLKETVRVDKSADCIKVQGVDSTEFTLACEV